MADDLAKKIADEEKAARESEKHGQEEEATGNDKANEENPDAHAISTAYNGAETSYVVAARHRDAEVKLREDAVKAAKKKKEDAGANPPNQLVEAVEAALEKLGEAHRKAAADCAGVVRMLAKVNEKGGVAGANASATMARYKQSEEAHLKEAARAFAQVAGLNKEQGEYDEAIKWYGEAASCYALAGDEQNQKLMTSRAEDAEAEKKQPKKK